MGKDKAKPVHHHRLQIAFDRGRKHQRELMLRQGWTPPFTPANDIHPAYYLFSGVAIGLVIAFVVCCLYGH